MLDKTTDVFQNVLWHENSPEIGNKIGNINVKTAVYTNVNGIIVNYRSKTAKIKKVILLNNADAQTLPQIAH